MTAHPCPRRFPCLCYVVSRCHDGRRRRVVPSLCHVALSWRGYAVVGSGGAVVGSGCAVGGRVVGRVVGGRGVMWCDVTGTHTHTRINPDPWERVRVSCGLGAGGPKFTHGLPVMNPNYLTPHPTSTSAICAPTSCQPLWLASFGSTCTMVCYCIHFHFFKYIIKILWAGEVQLNTCALR